MSPIRCMPLTVGVIVVFIDIRPKKLRLGVDGDVCFGNDGSEGIYGGREMSLFERAGRQHTDIPRH